MGQSDLNAILFIFARKSCNRRIENISKYLNTEYLTFAVAHSGLAIADYVVNIPKYEQLIRNIEKHYIILCCFNDALPDESTRYTKFVSDNTFFNLVESNAVPDKHKIASYLAKFNLRFVLCLSGLISKYEPKLPFVKSEKLNTSENINKIKYNKSDAWDYIFYGHKIQLDFATIARESGRVGS